jgi:hypothetical protein
MATSNPVFIRLSDLVGQTVFAQAVSRFDKENLVLSSLEWEAHPAKALWSCVPGSNHLGAAPYAVNVQRRSDGVWGVCSCAADRLCKHLAAGYLMFSALELGHSHRLGASCPGCLAPVPPPPPPGGGRILVNPSPVLRRSRPGRRKVARETKEIAAQVDQAIEKDSAVAVLDQDFTIDVDAILAAGPVPVAAPWNTVFCQCGLEITRDQGRCAACLEKDRSDLFG